MTKWGCSIPSVGDWPFLPTWIRVVSYGHWLSFQEDTCQSKSRWTRRKWVLLPCWRGKKKKKKHHVASHPPPALTSTVNLKGGAIKCIRACLVGQDFYLNECLLLPFGETTVKCECVQLPLIATMHWTYCLFFFHDPSFCWSDTTS